MNAYFTKIRLSVCGRTALAGFILIILLTGCGGGGGGGGSSQPQTVTITGTLQDKTTTNVLPNRTITVVNSSLAGTSDGAGQFTIGNVPVTSITLAVTDSNGTSDGNSAAIDLSKLSGNPRSVGVVVLSIYGSGPPAPPVSALTHS